MRETLAPDFLSDRPAEMLAKPRVQISAFHVERVCDLRRPDGLAEIFADELERLPDRWVETAITSVERRVTTRAGGMRIVRLFE